MISQLDISEMNEKWKKKRNTHYDVFNQLMTPLERHYIYKQDYDTGIYMARKAIDKNAKYLLQ